MPSASHERFRADTQSLIKSLEQILGKADAARRADEDAARREAKANEKAEAERLRQQRREQSHKLREAKVKTPRVDTEAREPSSGLVGWIAGLSSESRWHVPIATVAIALLGWIYPSRFFDLGSMGWPVVLTYGLLGILALGVVFRVRLNVMGGAELAVYWFSLVCFLKLVVFSVADLPTSSFLPIAALAVVTAAGVIAVRRKQIGGLEIAVYWFGASLILFWALQPLLAESAWLPWKYLNDIQGYRTAGVILAGSVSFSALILLLARALTRRSNLSYPEIAVYLIGVTYMLYVALLLIQATPSS